ncbi:helix-hairpin-helix domain-containing protein [Sulfurimonas sp. SAG-AH-194-L11]|nr:helix-hairpin-helix domain-containing protein [Sulfurimonas sp. SAG-AH-194-L11]
MKDNIIFKSIIIFLFSISSLFALVDLNNASSSELLALNGIGKAKAQKIINYRELNECFKSIDELANIDGISKKIISSNRTNLMLGICEKTQKKEAIASLLDVLLDPINIVFTIVIFVLGFIDHTRGKDLKSQIVSVGVLGTFVGIFIGLQAFNPEDITNSVNDILVGLKTAFFTSIVGMSVSTILSVTQTLKGKSEDE